MKTLELKAIREHLQESPPPAPSGTTMREWFAGLALMNPMLMAGVPESQRAAEAVRLADELIAALAPPRAPSLESMAAPSEDEMLAWDLQIEKQERLDRETCPAAPMSRGKTPTLRFGAVLPLPVGAPLPPVSIPGVTSPRDSLRDTRYCAINTERVTAKGK